MASVGKYILAVTLGILNQNIKTYFFTLSFPEVTDKLCTGGDNLQIGYIY